MKKATAASRRRREAGFTLIELMVAMVVSAIVVLGVYAFSAIQQSTATMHERNVRVQQALEGAMWTMAQDVRMAGLGFSRICTELRVYDGQGARLINPGAVETPSTAVADQITGSAYWVLRDGLQAHWNSTVGNDFVGDVDRSSSPASVADGFDVILADGVYVGTYGVFRLNTPVTAGMPMIGVRTSTMLDNTNADHLLQVRQLFPPGTFFMVARSPSTTANPFLAHTQGQCPLLQITGDVFPDPNDPQLWYLPVDGAVSGFDSDLGVLFDTAIDEEDWNPTQDNQIDASVIPLGRLRWSRYEIDYTIPTLPYLVRSDIIGYRQGTDPSTLGGIDYPHCGAGQCPAPQLHLPSDNDEPVAIAVGPMIEDMQVAVGCDGYTALAAAAAELPLPAPDVGFEEVGPAEGVGANQPNFQIDENSPLNNRTADEWLGNARSEVTAPDCVWYGTGQYRAADWVLREGSQSPPPAFRMSPQSIRITLVGSSEAEEAAGGLSSDVVLAVEDREPLQSPVGFRQRFTLTEVFTPQNLRWRDPTVL
ncbi:MAG: prepilin-type N-terminal cleavage/methylation domain-containing protein [Myxococcales bacterium]|nr:prepilin-type N-terminal cleavage/methylation domain-containing protein [Myxococcales bacterium]